ncbi:hypothetical protein KXW98_008563 [Aspergillus fumigatus]|jgi:protocatechuate 3,4-dioxygenase beta subunit|uniref:Extracellular dioxygenase, putative n=3 Tax=Aspergillus fumigatus TaxID=746128 RepID=Q4WYX8_ASPFU|nr:extracellular dioxygenase, putative [Aspergillus fumigatus Af293]EDP52296.1 extracellular dioxygenase, putative [Aspergillus fumigatus A1163]KAF4269542.1 hypothetical protein CNMCM8714_008176 [Aspergillus fumigatus]KMK54251.1 extracellular dioxygenase [Aspergillus fumigatus Z5]EAL92125.1 extracellular dioxygenase, putative [Aspergillus fumigatus Af293]KAF4276042.1 hypothetical protein CNMCM8812_006330 [Aspergillus fumigatus]
MQLKEVLSLYLLGVSLVFAHPGHEEKRASNELLAFKAHVRRGLSLCTRSFDESGLSARAIARRAKLASEYRRRKLAVRDTDDVLNTSHLSSADYTTSTDEREIFSSTGTCVLNPEGETGPFWVSGELIRSDIIENQAGVPVVLDIQFVDVSTCQAVEGLYIDTWSCNATGVYSGVSGNGNGNSADTSILDETFLRGIAKTDSDGVVSFNTLFPGHYSGRTTHHHIIAHLNATLLPNNTLTGGTVPHIGQLFWDQSLIDEVEATSPYSTNTVAQTTNAEDRVFSDETSGTTSDPVFNYVRLGDSVEDGLLGWVTVAVDLTATYTPNYSFVYTSSGSEAVSGNSGSSGSAPGSSGSAPSGGMGGGPGGF